jgi:hypothetical protein
MTTDKLFQQAVALIGSGDVVAGATCWSTIQN